MNYAERFHVEPHRVNPPNRWWLRLQAWDYARARRGAREAVDAHGLGGVSQETAKIYSDLILEIRGLKPNG